MSIALVLNQLASTTLPASSCLRQQTRLLVDLLLFASFTVVYFIVAASSCPRQRQNLEEMRPFRSARYTTSV